MADRAGIWITAALIDVVMTPHLRRKYFRVAVASGEVAANPPAADVYLEIIRRLNAERATTAAVEDSANGGRSARPAGLRVIAIPQPAQPLEALNVADATLALSMT